MPHRIRTIAKLAGAEVTIHLLEEVINHKKDAGEYIVCLDFREAREWRAATPEKTNVPHRI